MSSPSSRMLPPVGFSIPAISLARVDFPPPLGPVMTTNLLSGIVKLTSRMISRQNKYSSVPALCSPSLYGSVVLIRVLRIRVKTQSPYEPCVSVRCRIFKYIQLFSVLQTPTMTIVNYLPTLISPRSVPRALLWLQVSSAAPSPHGSGSCTYTCPSCCLSPRCFPDPGSNPADRYPLSGRTRSVR